MVAVAFKVAAGAGVVAAIAALGGFGSVGRPLWRCAHRLRGGQMATARLARQYLSRLCAAAIIVHSVLTLS